MSMSTYVKGINPPDEEYEKMKEVYYACKKANVDMPKEVVEFFDWREPDPEGLEIEIDEFCKEYQDEYRKGIDVDLTRLPDNIKILRFVNSW